MKYHDVLKDGPITVTHNGRKVAVLENVADSPGEFGLGEVQLRPCEVGFFPGLSVLPDKYDGEVARLTADPGDIQNSWMEAQPLFQFVSPNGQAHYEGGILGCLTSVKSGRREAYTPELTELIRNDPNVPKVSTDLRLHHLEHIAELNRLIDAAIDRQ